LRTDYCWLAVAVVAEICTVFVALAPASPEPAFFWRLDWSCAEFAIKVSINIAAVVSIVFFVTVIVVSPLFRVRLEVGDT
jgi:hypothetical protein